MLFVAPFDIDEVRRQIGLRRTTRDPTPPNPRVTTNTAGSRPNPQLGRGEGLGAFGAAIASTSGIISPEILRDPPRRGHARVCVGGRSENADRRAVDR